MPAYFVTGTDTGIGKTHVSVALLEAARAAGRSTLGLKPVAAGCEETRSEEHTSELQSQSNLVCRLLLEKKKKKNGQITNPPHRDSGFQHKTLALDEPTSDVD